MNGNRLVTAMLNNKALIHDAEYVFLEFLTSLDGCDRLILCTNAQGEKYVCSEQLWCSNAIPEAPDALICTSSSAQEKIEFFLSMFKGREGVYAKRYCGQKTRKSGYTPVCKNEWDTELCDKRKYKCPDCPSREFLSLTSDAIKAHLVGRDPLCRDVIAIYPMLADNNTWLLVADFDEDNWQAMRLPVYGTPCVIDCSYEDVEYIGIPRGCMDSITGLFEAHDIPFAIDDLRCAGCPIDISFKGTLRAEQEPAAQSLLAEDTGVLSATTAFGKTVIGAWLISQRKTNTLILVQSSALLEQWKVSLANICTET